MKTLPIPYRLTPTLTVNSSRRDTSQQHHKGNQEQPHGARNHSNQPHNELNALLPRTPVNSHVAFTTLRTALTTRSEEKKEEKKMGKIMN
ncbi:hypothetical protein E2C01_087227 [Portunus trituberculatus]|uniref:Uncharacterized protein n=1 Tax=Portunus trituberculatus TaxID=210409 RepID=A0A5B7JBW7_PORTR|nr:hypothetical protein [Portunus trituberculatus]